MCKLCSGVLAYLGQLGRLHWFRCRACGMQFSQTDLNYEGDDLD